jgi:phosphoglycolate phosphatase-like HAD superfamily hydrolase
MDATPRRLILWDVDGTLMSGGPLAREVFTSAVSEATGVDASDHGVAMSGKTDPQIALEIMTGAGVPGDHAESVLPAVLDRLQSGLADGIDRLRTEGKTHPGVVQVLERLHAEPGVVQTVLTGNMEGSARTKVSAFGLQGFLDLEVGAYGSDDPDRERLVPVAVERVREKYGWEPGPGEVWVIGDTPRDLACARAGNARCLLVGTGRYGLDVLAPLGADHSVAELNDPDAIASLLLS